MLSIKLIGKNLILIFRVHTGIFLSFAPEFPKFNTIRQHNVMFFFFNIISYRLHEATSDNLYLNIFWPIQLYDNSLSVIFFIYIYIYIKFLYETIIIIIFLIVCSLICTVLLYIVFNTDLGSNI